MSHPNESFTNLERFQPLVSLARTVADELVDVYSARQVVEERRVPPTGIGQGESTEVRVIPDDSKAAPITFVLYDSPGVMLRAGHWWRYPLPACHCDSCDDTYERNAAILRGTVDNVVNGRFRERLRIRLFGDGWRSWELGSSVEQGRVPRRQAKEMRRLAGSDDIMWEAWPRRAGQPSAG